MKEKKRVLQSQEHLHDLSLSEVSISLRVVLKYMRSQHRQANASALDRHADRTATPWPTTSALFSVRRAHSSILAPFFHLLKPKRFSSWECLPNS